MMTKEQYLEMRRTRQIDAALFYEYYNSKNPKIQIDLNTFFQIFRQYFQIYEQEIFDKMDVEFEVVICIFENTKRKIEKEQPIVINYL